MAGRPATQATNPAVVAALDCITGLQTARILAARGVPVIGVAADRRHFCARTRVVRRVIEAPTAGEGLVGAL
jgi:D-aspartate ligase